MKIWHLLGDGSTKGKLAHSISCSSCSVYQFLVLCPLLIGGQDSFFEERWRCLAQSIWQWHYLHRGMHLSMGCSGVLVEHDISPLIMIHSCETFHEVPDFFPLIIIAFQEVGSMLDGYDDCTTLTQLCLCR